MGFNSISIYNETKKGFSMIEKEGNFIIGKNSIINKVLIHCEIAVAKTLVHKRELLQGLLAKTNGKVFNYFTGASKVKYSSRSCLPFINSEYVRKNNQCTMFISLDLNGRYLLSQEGGKLLEYCFDKDAKSITCIINTKIIKGQAIRFKFGLTNKKVLVYEFKFNDKLNVELNKVEITEKWERQSVQLEKYRPRVPAKTILCYPEHYDNCKSVLNTHFQFDTNPPELRAYTDATFKLLCKELKDDKINAVTIFGNKLRSKNMKILKDTFRNVNTLDIHGQIIQNKK